jgi:hypothetical protein
VNSLLESIGIGRFLKVAWSAGMPSWGYSFRLHGNWESVFVSGLKLYKRSVLCYANVQKEQLRAGGGLLVVSHLQGTGPSHGPR